MASPEANYPLGENSRGCMKPSKKSINAKSELIKSYAQLTALLVRRKKMLGGSLDMSLVLSTELLNLR